MKKDEFSTKVDVVLQTPVPTEKIYEEPLKHDVVFLDKDATSEDVEKFINGGDE